MAAQQCPNCGRFLRKLLVEGLADSDQPCPGCDLVLTAPMFSQETTTSDSTPASGPFPEDSARVEPSVRPPDLSPAEVRDDASDVLDGWDVGAGAAEIASWNADRRPFPTDTVVVGASALVGAAVGAAVGPKRVRASVLGAVCGIVVAGSARQVWRLQS